MIFDLLTIKDLYTRWSFYPNSRGIQPFWQGAYDSGEAKRYEIEEGCYFEFKNSGYGSRIFTNLNYEHLTTSEMYTRIHSMKITYRSNRGIHIVGGSFPDKVEGDSKASDTFKTVTVILDTTLNKLGRISIMDESWNLNPEKVSEGFPKAGDYLIIKKIEFLTI